MINITECRIFPTADFTHGRILCFASITLEDCFVIRGLKIVEGRKGHFVSMPARKERDEYYDICFPLTNEMRAAIQEKVIKEYWSWLKKQAEVDSA